jgi:hypothetical protein
MRMFKDIGYKIETVASVVCAIGIVGSLFAGFVLVVGRDQMFDGIIAAALGILLSWLSTIVLYGFGTLVRTSEESNDRMKKIEDTLDEMSAYVKAIQRQNTQQ